MLSLLFGNANDLKTSNNWPMSQCIGWKPQRGNMRPYNLKLKPKTTLNCVFKVEGKKNSRIL